MSELNQGKPSNIFLILLILLLIAVMGAQLWYMLDLKKQLDSLQADYLSIQQLNNKIEEKDAPAEVIEDTADTPVISSTPDLAQQPAQPPAQQSFDPVPVIPAPSPKDYRYNPQPYSQTWDPFEDFRRMEQHMDRLFNDRHRRPERPGRPDFQYHFKQDLSAPKLDVREERDRYTVFVKVPGTDAKSLSVKLDGQRLTVSGKQHYEKKDRDASGRITFSERRSGNFRRSITLPEPVEQRGMQTQINNGVLSITIPKIKY